MMVVIVAWINVVLDVLMLICIIYLTQNFNRMVARLERTIEDKNQVIRTLEGRLR